MQRKRGTSALKKPKASSSSSSPPPPNGSFCGDKRHKRPRLDLSRTDSTGSRLSRVSSSGSLFSLPAYTIWLQLKAKGWRQINEGPGYFAAPGVMTAAEGKLGTTLFVKHSEMVAYVESNGILQLPSDDDSIKAPRLFTSTKGLPSQKILLGSSSSAAGASRQPRKPRLKSVSRTSSSGPPAANAANKRMGFISQEGVKKKKKGKPLEEKETHPNQKREKKPIAKKTNTNENKNETGSSHLPLAAYLHLNDLDEDLKRLRSAFVRCLDGDPSNFNLAMETIIALKDRLGVLVTAAGKQDRKERRGTEKPHSIQTAQATAKPLEQKSPQQALVASNKEPTKANSSPSSAKMAHKYPVSSDWVLARWMGYSAWYRGHIIKCEPGGTYTIRYMDGDLEEGVKEEHLEPICVPLASVSDQNEICAFCSCKKELRGAARTVASPADLQMLGPFYVGKNRNKRIYIHKMCYDSASYIKNEEGKGACTDGVVQAAYDSAQRIKCKICGEKGAAVGCGLLSCHFSAHYTCIKMRPDLAMVDEKNSMWCVKHHTLLGGAAAWKELLKKPVTWTSQCGKCFKGGQLVECTWCNQCYHEECDDILRRGVPRGNFACSMCRKEMIARSAEVSKKIKMKLSVFKQRGTFLEATTAWVKSLCCCAGCGSTFSGKVCVLCGTANPKYERAKATKRLPKKALKRASSFSERNRLKLALEASLTNQSVEEIMEKKKMM